MDGITLEQTRRLAVIAGAKAPNKVLRKNQTITKVLTKLNTLEEFMRVYLYHLRHILLFKD